MIRHLKTMIGVGLLLCLFGGISQAQTGSIEKVTINHVEATPKEAEGSNTVSAYVSVAGENNQPIGGLTQNNFTVVEDGQEVELASVTVATDPMSIVLVIDTSGSMAAVGPDGRLAIDAAKEAAVSFIQALDDEDQVAVYSFNDEVTLNRDLTLDHNAAINAINMITYKDYGGTCLYDAVFEAVKKSAGVSLGRRAVVVLTDGVDEAGDGTCSTHTFSDVIEKATSTSINAPIFTIGLGSQVDERELLRMAGLTGGQGLIVPDSSQLTALFNSLAQQLKNQYLLTYQTQAVSGNHLIVVRAEAGGSPEEDEAQVYIPPASVAPESGETPTEEEPPAFAISIAQAKADTPAEGQMEIVVDLSQAENIERLALYMDDNLVQETLAPDPPFHAFVLEMGDFSVGEHTIQIEATDQAGTKAIDKRELILPEPSTETTDIATPEAVEAASPEAEVAGSTAEETTGSGSNNILFIIIGIIVFLFLLLVIAIIIFFVLRRKGEKTEEGYYPGVSPVEEVSPKPFLTDDTYEEQHDPFETMDVVDEYEATSDDTVVSGSTPPARLVVIKGLNVLKGDVFPITKSRTTIGRNAGGKFNDIDIQDKPVSRRQHAEIVYNGREFTIHDNNSKYGTFVNGERVGGKTMPLQDGAEIDIGTRTKLRFEILSFDEWATKDVDEEDDPFATQDVIG